MKQFTIRQTFVLIRWVCVWVIIYSQLSLFTFTVAAQNPTPIPTPTPANTPTPTSSTPTPTPTTDGSSATPTPTNTSTPSTTRLIKFADDTDGQDLAPGECVLFSWVVRGDVAWVEFDRLDDTRDPSLVDDIDEREECLDDDMRYQLIVTWLDGTKTKSDVLSIEIDESLSGGSGGGGGGGNGDSVSATRTIPTPGSFVQVTPIPVTTTLSSASPSPVADASVPVAPTGVLASVHTLPETGALPLPLVTPTPESAIIQPEDNLISAQSHPVPWLVFAGGVVLLLVSVAIGPFLVKFLRQLS